MLAESNTLFKFLFVLTSTTLQLGADIKLNNVNMRGTVIIKAYIRPSHLRNFIVKCCGKQSCSTDEYDDYYYENGTAVNTDPRIQSGSGTKGIGIHGLSGNKNKRKGINNKKFGAGAAGSKQSNRKNNKNGYGKKVGNRKNNNNGFGMKGGGAGKGSGSRGDSRPGSGRGVFGGGGKLGPGSSNSGSGNANGDDSSNSQGSGADGNGELPGNTMNSGGSGSGGAGGSGSGTGGAGTGAGGSASGTGGSGTGTGGSASGTGGSGTGIGGSGTGEDSSGSEAGGSGTGADGSGTGVEGSETGAGGSGTGTGGSGTGTGGSGTGVDGSGTGEGGSGTGADGSGAGDDGSGSGADGSSSDGTGSGSGTGGTGTSGGGGSSDTAVGNDSASGGSGTGSGSTGIISNGGSTSGGISTSGKSGVTNIGGGTSGGAAGSGISGGLTTKSGSASGSGTLVGSGSSGASSATTIAGSGGAVSATTIAGSGSGGAASAATIAGSGSGGAASATTIGGSGSGGAASETTNAGSEASTRGSGISNIGSETSVGGTGTTSATSGGQTSTTTVSGSSTSTTLPPTTTAITKPPCPVQCVKNDSLFETNGELKKPYMYGAWVEKCGRTYLLGNILGRFQNSWDFCCSLGMTPLMFETLTEQTCFGAMANMSWPYNYNYWTSAKGIPGNYSWCAGTGGVPLKIENLWDKGQPDFLRKNQFCVHVKIYPNVSKALLTDRNCTDWFMISCEGPPTPPPTTAKPSCPPIACTKNPTLFKADLINLKDPKSLGTWREICGRVYLFGPETSAGKKNWADSRKLCCSVGMTALAIESIGELKCLNKKSFITDVIWGKFWTSGTDQQYEGQFMWCGNTTINSTQVAWKAGQPDNAGGVDNCVATTIANNSFLIEDVKCDSLVQYACEAPSASHGGLGSSMQAECAEYWSLTQTEIDTILNGTSRTYNAKFSNGVLIEDTTFKLIELVSQEDEVQLQTDVDTYFDCRTRGGEDECGTAEAIFDCGHKSPASSGSIAEMIVAVETNASAMLAPVPCVQPTCTLCGAPNPVKLTYLNTNTVPISDGVLLAICGKRYIFVSIPIPYSSAESFCCSYGMKLVAIESTAEKSCLMKNGIPGPFWTSGLSMGCPSFGYWWCAVQEPVDSSVIGNVPFVSLKILPCYAVTISPVSVLLQDYPCISPMNYICEEY